MPMIKKYHVALWFAGEDRAYLKMVARRIYRNGSSCLLELHSFEEADLGGKNPCDHLIDIYYTSV